MNFKKIMSCLLVAIMCLSMLLSLASCGNKTDESTDTGSGDTQTSTDTDIDKPVTSVIDRVINDEYTLVLQTSTMDGVFSPFFYSSAYDADVIGMVNVNLLTVDASGAIVAGDQYDTVAKEYSIYYTNDTQNFTKKDSYEEGDYVVYEIVLKNGAKFSDGTDITVDDAMFGYYVLLDPAYDGSSTLYTLPILGLTDYRTQTPNADKYTAIANAIFEAGEGYTVTASDSFTQEQYDTYWKLMEKSGVAFAQNIVDYVLANYAGNPEYVAAYGPKSGLINDAAKVALGMAMWGFGSIKPTYEIAADGTYGLASDKNVTLYVATTSEDDAVFADEDGTSYRRVTAEDTDGSFVYISGKSETVDGAYVVASYSGDRYSKSSSDIFVDILGNEYDINTTTELTAATYWENLKAGYSDEEGVVDYANLDDTESAGYPLIASANEAFVLGYSKVGSVSSIDGLRTTKKTIDGVEYDVIRVILTEQNPKAILSLGETVVPAHYYTAGYKYPENAIVNYGVELGINGNNSFMDHLKLANGAPVGGGTYKFVSYDGDIVRFVRNEYHETLGDDNVYNANIKNVAFKVVDSGKEFDAMTAGDVHYATVSADADVMKDLAKPENSNLTPMLVDNNGYGYICINPNATAYGLDNLYARIALTSVFDLAKVYDYYPAGLAEVIYRSQTQVSWAYPEGAEAIYPFDETLKTAIDNYKLAGYTYDEATGKFTDVPDIDFYLPSDAASHPAGGIFIKAQELLATIGVTANIKTDTNLIANIKKGAVPVYALAWQSAQDPDMYQVYHIKSQAESVISNGIVGLYADANATKADFGTIDVLKLDGNTVKMTQKEALEYLAFLIEEGVKYMSVEERAPIYQTALTVLAQLNIEIPTYQRKNLFVANNTIIDTSTLSDTITPYWGPMAEMWKVSFAEGVTGNQTIQVTVNVD
ncbi:MAG: ABC transporter substrate-binding protein [Eubacteriales bacterium]